MRIRVAMSVVCSSCSCVGRALVRVAWVLLVMVRHVLSTLCMFKAFCVASQSSMRGLYGVCSSGVDVLLLR